MFGESQAIGFVPIPSLDLRAGNLYGLVVSLLIFGSCLYSAWSIIIRSGQIPAGKIFSYFLLALGFYWLLEAFTGGLVWLNLPYI